MTRGQLFEPGNRRQNLMDRRQCQDRRGHAIPIQEAADETVVLHELLRDAHARIRLLEKAVDELTKSI